ncbi:hypothetical protein ATY79_26715 [Rhizobium sp. R693]|nr:hypothetical protein ATY79_26715 [Rhizobium sp. R693]
MRLSIGEKGAGDERRKRKVPSDSLRRHDPVQVQRVLLSQPLGRRPCLSSALVADKRVAVIHKMSIAAQELAIGVAGS